MILGVILAIGESLSDFKANGQLKRLIDYNIRHYSQEFDEVLIFSYKNEKNFKLPKKCRLIANTLGLHRYPYSILMPIIKRKEITKCDVLRGLQLSGGIPAVIAKIIYGNRFVINYGYDYSKFAAIEGKKFQSFFYKLIQKPIIGLADRVIVTSTGIKKLLEKMIEKSKIIYLPNGVDLNLFRAVKRRQTNKVLSVIYIGRLEKQKNLKNLIRALGQLKNAKALLYGKGSQEEELKNLAKMLKVDLKVKPPIDYWNIPQVMSRADVFVLPSLIEGNPKILLEAMACQKAVVGTNVEGINEIITDSYNGFLCWTGPESIAKAINKLENKTLKEKVEVNARVYVEKNYDINKLLNIETSLLKKIASSNEK